MKINCDMGESFGQWKMGEDASIMPYINMANIACGFHASDPLHMSKTVALARRYRVAIGAHPGYPDMLGFGRREIAFSEAEIESFVLYQVGALQAICHAQQSPLEYVKPHGALYNTMMKDEAVLIAVLKAISGLQSAYPAGLPLMVLANSQAEKMAKLAGRFGVSLIYEAFCDRAYADDGSLVPRTAKNSVLATDKEIEARIRGLVKNGEIITISGKVLSVHADTVCVHGDHPEAFESVKKVRRFIDKA